MYSLRGGLGFAVSLLSPLRAAMKYFFLILLFALPALSGVRTCEELAAKIANRPYVHSLSDTALEWPKSITQKSTELPRVVDNELLPLYKSAQHGYFQTKDKTALAYSFFKADPQSWIQGKPKATLLISHGLGESRPQWLDQIKTFTREGYDVFIYEHRGQAHSDRPLSNYQKVHVDHFSQYEQDMHEFLEQVVRAHTQERVYGVGFSLGGLVATFNHIHHPDDFDALVAIAPAYQIRTRHYPVIAARGLIDLMVGLGKGKDYSFFQKDFDDDKLDLLRQHTHDSDRWESFLRVLKLYPMTLPGGLTHQWLSEILAANHQIQKEIRNLNRPTLVIEALSDTLLDPRVTRKMVAHHPWITNYVDEKAYHSIIHDSDSIRNPALTEIIRYLVHPERLDENRGAPSWETLLAQSSNFSKRQESALSRYAIEEAYRRWRLANPSGPIPQELKNEMERASEELNSSSAGQRGLYEFLRLNRQTELKKLYPNQN